MSVTSAVIAPGPANLLLRNETMRAWFLAIYLAALAFLIDLARSYGPVSNADDLACMVSYNTFYQPGDLVLAERSSDSTWWTATIIDAVSNAPETYNIAWTPSQMISTITSSHLLRADSCTCFSNIGLCSGVACQCAWVAPDPSTDIRICESQATWDASALQNVMSNCPALASRADAMLDVISTNAFSTSSSENIVVPETTTDTAAAATAGCIGGLMLLFVVVCSFVWPAKTPDASATLPPERCCNTFHDTSSRAHVLLASRIIGGLTLLLCVVGDILARFCQLDVTAAMGWTALALDLVGGIVLYSLSSCGCTLCCACSCGRCSRASLATAAVAFSILFWVVSLSIIGYCSLDAQSWATAIDFSKSRDAGTSPSAMSTTCNVLHFLYFTSDQVLLSQSTSYPDQIAPYGLLSWGGLLAATALLLQGHFVTLVPEARLAILEDSPAAAASAGPGGGSAPAAGLPSAQGAPPAGAPGAYVVVLPMQAAAAAAAVTRPAVSSAMEPAPWKLVVKSEPQ